MKPSTSRCLAALRDRPGQWVSGNTLFQASGTRYGGRVFELRHDFGFRIDRRSAPNGSAVDEYQLIEAPEQLSMGIAS